MNYLSERQEIFRGMVEDKIRMQSRPTGTYYDQIFEKMKELEGKKSEEALLLVQKKLDLWRYQNKRDEARRLQRSGSSRKMKKEADSQDLLSFQSCSLESPRKTQDVQVVMSETAGKATSGRGEDAWRLAPEGETETLETEVVSHGVNVDRNGEGRHERVQVKEIQKAKRSARRTM